MQQFKVKIISKSAKLIEDEFDKVSVPSSTGEIEILADHKPLISEVKTGLIKLLKGNLTSELIVFKGNLIFHDNLLQIALDEAEIPQQLVKDEIEEAIKLAEKRIASKEINSAELIQLEKKLFYERFKLGYINQ